MFKLYLIIMVLFITLRKATAKSSPVLIYGHNTPPRPVFPTIKQAEFMAMMKELSQNYTFVVFLEDNLQARHFQCTTLTVQECFGDFPEGLGNYTFYGSVENPFIALELIFNKTSPIFVDEDGHLQKSEVCEVGYRNKLNVVQLTMHVDENMNLLSLRGEVMRDISEQIKNCDLAPIFFFITMTLDDIEFEEEADTNMLKVKPMSTIIKDGMTVIDVATDVHQMFNEADGPIKNVTFKVIVKPGLYTMVNATYDDEEFKGRNIPWPKNFSPYTPGLVFKHGSKILRINYLKLEPLSGETILSDNDLNLYDDEEDDWNTCVYVTPGIMMGLFVMAILGTIMYMGLTMLLDIKSNDRFDGQTMRAFMCRRVES